MSVSKLFDGVMNHVIRTEDHVDHTFLTMLFVEKSMVLWILRRYES